MEVPCQCLSSLPTKHPAVVLSILSSAPVGFTEQRMEVEKDDEEQREREEESRQETQVDGDAVETTRGRKRRRRGTGTASVKGHGVLQLDEQALRGTNKIVTAGPPLW